MAKHPDNGKHLKAAALAALKGHNAQYWLDRVSKLNAEAVQLEGWDDAIIGVAHAYGKSPVLAYSISKILAALVADGLTEDEAQEHFDANILGGYFGEGTPIFVNLDQ